MSFPRRSVAAPCLCIKSGIIWTCDWCIPVVPHPNNRTCTHYTGDRRASNVRFCLKPDATELFGSIAKEPQDNKSRRISHDPRSPISLCNLEHTLGRPKLYASKLGKITVKTKTYTFVKLKVSMAIYFDPPLANKIDPPFIV